MTTKLIRVFVYGTLKKGEPNHHVISDQQNGFSNFIGCGVTKAKYPLVIGTRYNIPFLLNVPGKGHQINGEVYEVDEKMFGRLDELEDYPDFYTRELNEIELKDSTNTTSCWVYLLKNYPEKLLTFPFLTEYKDTEEKPYQERCKRLENILAKNDLEFQF